MTQRAQQVLQDCQSWPAEEREELAALLYESLESYVDENYDAAWEAEIASRLKEFDDGLVQGIPSEQVHREVQEIIDAHRVSSTRSK